MTMGDDSIDDGLLYNCTAKILQKVALKNVTSVWTLNRTQVIDLLSIVYEEEDATLPLNLKTDLKDFLTSCLFPQQRPYDLPWWQKLAWTSVFGAMLLVATGGNAIVMWIVLGLITMPLAKRFNLSQRSSKGIRLRNIANQSTADEQEIAHERLKSA